MRRLARIVIPMATLLALACASPAVHAQQAKPRPEWPRVAEPPDEAKLRAAGLRKIAGKHITLVTDLPSSPEVDGLPAIFDQAYPQWCEYFGLQKEATKPWRVNGYLIGDKERFQKSGLIPADLPAFLHGYSVGLNLWLHNQPVPYYQRHLLLHEGTHAFMSSMFGHCGPPWYMEGMAELIATHRYEDGKLTIHVMPRTKEEVPYWGRIKLVREAVAEGRALTIDEILNYGPTAHLKNEPYAFCWALCAMLDGNPRYRQRFRELPLDTAQPDFNDRFRKRFANDWQQLKDDWQLFERELDYGYDPERAGLVFSPAATPSTTGGTLKVAADRGWQSTGIRLEKGKAYPVKATGRYQLAKEPKVWWSEPGGVSIRYHQGQPLGMLLATVVPDELTSGMPNPFTTPQAVGGAGTITPTISGTLYLRINDSPSELADNAGTAEVVVSAGASR